MRSETAVPNNRAAHFLQQPERFIPQTLCRTVIPLKDIEASEAEAAGKRIDLVPLARTGQPLLQKVSRLLEISLEQTHTAEADQRAAMPNAEVEPEVAAFGKEGPRTLAISLGQRELTQHQQTLHIVVAIPQFERRRYPPQDATGPGDTPPA